MATCGRGPPGRWSRPGAGGRGRGCRVCLGGMTHGGESRALYVVQRHFRRVRRGYAPGEVDRHLQLVSQWFAEHRVGELARELQARLQEREEAAVQAEQDAR